MLQDIQPASPAPTTTIDTQMALHSFGLLMQPDSAFHLLCLVGPAKTGKSHLLTKVFPGPALLPSTSGIARRAESIADRTTNPQYCRELFGPPSLSGLLRGPPGLVPTITGDHPRCQSLPVFYFDLCC